MARESYPWIDRFRLMAAWMVVAIHTLPLASLGGAWDELLTLGLGRAAVPFFFMTTGFFLYASHMLLMQLPEKALMLFLPHNDAGALITYVLVPVFTVGLVVGIARIMALYLPGVYGLLTGGRGSRRSTQTTK